MLEDKKGREGYGTRRGVIMDQYTKNPGIAVVLHRTDTSTYAHNDTSRQRRLQSFVQFCASSCRSWRGRLVYWLFAISQLLALNYMSTVRSSVCPADCVRAAAPRAPSRLVRDDRRDAERVLLPHPALGAAVPHRARPTPVRRRRRLP